MEQKQAENHALTHDGEATPFSDTESVSDPIAKSNEVYARILTQEGTACTLSLASTTDLLSP